MTPLKMVDESWHTGLAIVAHPDDLEYGAASAIAKWTAQGKNISYVLASSGEAGIDSLAPDLCGPRREEEQRMAAEIVGVQQVGFLGYPDGVIEYGLDLRRDIAREIRKTRPEVVITGNFRESWGPGMPNQADHIAVGRAVLDAVADAGNRWIFRELNEHESLAPWNGVKLILAAGSPEQTHGVDVTDFLDRGIASLRAHEAYLAGLGNNEMSDPTSFLTTMAEQAGSAIGCKYGTTFERYLG